MTEATATSVAPISTNTNVNTEVDLAAVKAAPTVTNSETSPTIFSAEKAASGGTLDVKSEDGKPKEIKDTTVLGDALSKPVEVNAPEATAQEAPKSLETPPTVVEGDKTLQDSKEKGQSVEPAPPPSFEAFTVPDGIELNQERTKIFTDLLTELETEGKTDHVLVQKFGQKAVDFHISEIQKTVTDLQKSQQDAWDRQKVQWKEEFLKDPNIGGENSKVTIEAANSFLRTHGGTEQQQKEFRSLMDSSGLGNHPVMIRLLANAGRVMREGQPLAAQSPATSVKSKVATLYGSLAN